MAEAQDRTPEVDDDDAGRAHAEAFVARWQGVTASELSTSQSFGRAVP